jgi:hypothetical protein
LEFDGGIVEVAMNAAFSIFRSNSRLPDNSPYLHQQSQLFPDQEIPQNAFEKQTQDLNTSIVFPPRSILSALSAI